MQCKEFHDHHGKLLSNLWSRQSALLAYGRPRNIDPSHPGDVDVVLQGADLSEMEELGLLLVVTAAADHFYGKHFDDYVVP